MKSSGNRSSLSIGQIAGRFGLPTHVLRHWEAFGLLSPARDAGGRRRYSRTDMQRVAVILRAKEAGFSLLDIRELFTVEGQAARDAVLRRRRAQLVRRIAAAQASLDLIECALGCQHEDIVCCGHFQAFLAARINAG